MSFDNGVLLPVSSSSMAMESRNHIRQGLRCLIQEKDIVLTDFLGKGAFGFVRKGEWTTQKGEKVNDYNFTYYDIWFQPFAFFVVNVTLACSDCQSLLLTKNQIKSILVIAVTN